MGSLRRLTTPLLVALSMSGAVTVTSGPHEVAHAGEPVRVENRVDAPAPMTIKATHHAIDSTTGRQMAEAGAHSIASRTRANERALERTGVALYFGDQSWFRDFDKAEQREWVEEHTVEGARPRMPHASDCVTWAMEHLGAAYRAVGRGARWNEIKHIVTQHKGQGTVLAQELQKDGWEAVYFNPDTKHPEDGNPEHSVTARRVDEGKGYYGLQVQHQVVNYAPTPGMGTALDTSGLSKLKHVPFFFGLARGGDHTFVGHRGTVSEFHWDAMPDEEDAIEQTPLNDFVWNSGLLMVPPGTWPAP